MLVLALPVASPTGAAGLGRLLVQSALGEPFAAEIDLLAAGDAGAAPVPRLAPPESYALAGFRYHPALATASVTLRRHANGSQVIAVATERRIEEPFLQLLVELQSSRTRIVRGYVALLDPPGYGLPPAASAAVYPATVPAAKVAPARPVVAPSPPPAPAAAAPAAMKTAAATAPDLERRIARLEEQLNAGAQALAGMLERVAVMEQAVAELRRGLEMRSAAAAAMSPQTPVTPAAPAPLAPKPAAPPAASPAADPVADLPPRRSGGSDSLLNMALLVLAGGLVVLLVGLGYWMLWGRRAPARP